MKLAVQRIDQSVDVPSYAHPSDAGLDLRSCEEKVIAPQERAVIKTGLKIAIPQGHVGLVWDKSGNAVKMGLTTMAGVIDAGYRGEIGVVVLNTGNEPITVTKNMKVAQMLIQPVVTAEITEVEDLDDTSRGEGGFGSTGTH